MSYFLGDSGGDEKKAWFTHYTNELIFPDKQSSMNFLQLLDIIWILSAK